MNKMKDHLQSQGLEPADLPVAFISHEVIAIGIALAAWGGCYILQPSRTVAATLFARNETVKAALERANAEVAKITWLHKVPLFHRDPLRSGTSLAESIVFRGFAKPITFTFKDLGLHRVHQGLEGDAAADAERWGEGGTGRRGRTVSCSSGEDSRRSRKRDGPVGEDCSGLVGVRLVALGVTLLASTPTSNAAGYLATICFRSCRLQLPACKLKFFFFEVQIPAPGGVPSRAPLAIASVSPNVMISGMCITIIK